MRRGASSVKKAQAARVFVAREYGQRDAGHPKGRPLPRISGPVRST